MELNQSKMLELVEKTLRNLSFKTIYFSTDKIPPYKSALILSCPRILIQLSGLKWIEFSDQSNHIKTELEAGDVLFCPAFTWTRPKWHLDGEMIALVYFKNYLRAIYINQKNNQPRHGPDIYYHLHRAANPAAWNLVHALEVMASQPKIRNSAPMIIKSLIELAAFDIKTDTSEKHSKAFYTWQIISEYLHENYTQDITRQELADLFELHPGYVSRLVKNNAGVTLQEYIIQMRMELARKLLEEPHARVLDIAKMCGYNDVSYFIKSFHKYFGESPGQYHTSKRKKN